VLYLVKAKWVRAAGEKTVFKREEFSSLVYRTADWKSIWIRKCLWSTVATRSTHSSPPTLILKGQVVQEILAELLDVWRWHR